MIRRPPKSTLFPNSTLSRSDNCQVAVTLSLATHAASLPVAYRLYLPQEWAQDPERRSKAGVPEDITFQTRSEEHTSELQSRQYLVCRLLLEKKTQNTISHTI